MAHQIENIIYGLCDPRFNNEIRYIGQSSRGLNRPKDHTRPSILRSKSHKNSWIKSLLSLGLQPSIKIVDYVSSSEHLNKAERFWIATYREMGAHLTNHNNGGEGQRGFRHSNGAREKMGISQKRRRSFSPECRRKMRISSYNGAKTSCKNGHLYSMENTYTRSDGSRSCRVCKRAADRVYRKRMKECGIKK